MKRGDIDKNGKPVNKKNTVEKKSANKNGVARLVIAGLCIIIEIAFLLFLYGIVYAYAPIVGAVVQVLAIILVIKIYAQQKTAAIKVPWILIIIAVPVFGLLLYALIGYNPHTRKMKTRYAALERKTLPMLADGNKELSLLKSQNPQAESIAYYLKNIAGYPTYNDSDIEYYDSASKGLEAQLEELAKAKEFIFMEYHAIENAQSWKRIQAVLEDRVRAGVDVRVFYDDMGSISFINKDFVRLMEKVGIKCRVFNPFSIGLNLFLNNRDHRKITVIDGVVGFTGGYNLANEYFNLTHPYGEWKDTGIKITGEAVNSLTVTFLQMWNASKEDKDNDLDFRQFIRHSSYMSKEKGAFIVPYADSPLDEYHVGEDVYLSMIDKATDYCYLMTPYLILSDEMSRALRLAAMRGVDVRIVTPGIPDKKTVYKITRSFYPDLVSRGVRIFEWTPGFCHAKMSITDGKMATCGTINLDFRSLYYHFENGCFFCNCQAVKDIRSDFNKTFAQCREVTEEYKYGKKKSLKFSQQIRRLIAGLL